MNDYKVILTSLHHIDIDTNSIITKNPNQNDAHIYIISLISKISSNKNIREYTNKSNTTEVIRTLLDICTSIDSYNESALTTAAEKLPDFYKANFLTIASRLLREQLDAQSKYKSLTNIKKGSLIQSLIELDDEYLYLMALVDHNKFIDETDLTYKQGLPDDSKIALKSCLIHLSKNSIITKIYLTDSGPKIADYWCDGFLDLKPCKDNKTNTKNAYTCIKQVLSSNLSKKFSSDYSALKNALNVYFSQNTSFSYDTCMDFLFNSYTPSNPDLKLNNLREKFDTLAKNNNFDNLFEIDSSMIKSELNDRYTVNSNIELKIKKPLDKIKETIYTKVLDNGDKVLVIHSVDEKTLKQFNFNNEDI